VVADINDAWDSHSFTKIFEGPAADDGQMDSGEIAKLFQMALHFRWAISQLGSRGNGGERPVIVEKEKQVLGLSDPGLNVIPVFEKVFHGRHYSTGIAV
jgi:hypothetical protein